MIKNARNLHLTAAAGLPENGLTFASEVSFLEAAATDGEKQLRKFTMTAYTGAAMSFGFLDAPVIIDLQGLRATNKPRPILKDHSRSQIVGHTTEITIEGGKNLIVQGIVSGTSPAAKEVVDTSRNGFPWQASVGVSVQRMEEVKAGAKAMVNGEEVTGPVYIARATSLSEVSFVALGADDQTTAAITAAQNKGLSMDFAKWLNGLGLNASELSADQRTKLEAKFNAEVEAAKPKTVPVPAPAAPANQPPAADPVAELRINAAAEMTRIGEINAICGLKHADIAAKAVAGNWDANKTKLEVLLAERPVVGAPAIGSGTGSLTRQVIEAAALISANLSEKRLAKSFDAKTIEAAAKMGRIGLQDICRMACEVDGVAVPSYFGDGRALIQASFTTVSLPNILESLISKTLLDAYESLRPVALDICRVGSVRDFKQVGRYRLLGTGNFERVGQGGELKHAALGDQKFTNQAATYGQILTLTREDVINDDLGAFLDLPRMMGMAGAATIDDLFFTLLLSNPNTFFGSGNANQITGGTSVLSFDGLSRALTLMRKLKGGPNARGNTKDRKPLNVQPRFLLVPPELEMDANNLVGSPNIVTAGGTGLSKTGTVNPHFGKYEVKVAPHLSDAIYSGNSATGWYLFADPATIPAAEVVFLNGQQTPTVERVASAPDILGVSFRAWLDVGVNMMDSNGAVAAAGA